MKISRTIVFYAHQMFKKFRERLNFLNNLYAKGYLDYKRVDYCEDIKFYGKPRLQFGKNCQIHIGQSFICRSGQFTTLDNGAYSSILLFDNARLTIGDFSGMTNTIIVSKHSITIGNYVNIGNGTILLDSDLHSLNWQIRSDRSIDSSHSSNKPIVIGDNVFIGMRSMILKGVTIGDKSIVAAGSVVTCDIPSGEIWGGNPAKMIKKIL